MSTNERSSSVYTARISRLPGVQRRALIQELSRFDEAVEVLRERAVRNLKALALTREAQALSQQRLESLGDDPVIVGRVAALLAEAELCRCAARSLTSNNGLGGFTDSADG